jgi:hypothetical protein
MKNWTYLTVLSGLFAFSSDGSEFANLNLNNPNTNNLTDYAPSVKVGPANELLQGWSILRNGKPYTGNALYVADPGVAASHMAVRLTLYNTAFGPSLLSSTSIFPPDGEQWTLEQTAVVPPDALTLAILGRFSVQLSIDGVRQDPWVTGGFAGFEQVFNVSQYRGKETSLRFDFMGEDLGILGFRSQAIPEPSTVALFMLGAAGLLWRTRNFS